MVPPLDVVPTLEQSPEQTIVIMQSTETVEIIMPTLKQATFEIAIDIHVVKQSVVVDVPTIEPSYIWPF
ncbi:hypothetical protein V6N13_147614 [Hibiscus sabdariffa]|uniref:Uncharacterized protein n=1 Tax=Hibiscus sabdariffa TaxID=183260 RepID=A0ABR2TWV7_9ROSI